MSLLPASVTLQTCSVSSIKSTAERSKSISLQSESEGRNNKNTRKRGFEGLFDVTSGKRL